jgi:hypothetical protein
MLPEYPAPLEIASREPKNEQFVQGAIGLLDKAGGGNTLLGL